MKMLSQLRSQAIYRQLPLELPASFLVDRTGRLSAFYSEPVARQQLTADLAVISEPTTTMDQAFPFPGRSGLKLLPFGPSDLAAAYVEGGYFQEAEEELIRYLVETRRALNKNQIQPTKDLARKIERAYVYLGTLLRSLGRNSEAQAVLKQGLELLPKSSKLEQAVTTPY
jgi:tetratricopeptide (TPR) repeat protein